jgi:hypothetical protein
MPGYQLQHLFPRAPYTIRSMPERRERNMKKIAVALLVVGSLSVAGPASAHGNGGDVVGALIGGALLGAVVTSALNRLPATGLRTAGVSAGARLRRAAAGILL